MPEFAQERPVKVRGLVKRYGRLTAVDRVDLTVERGDVYGFRGPNGAGKTTTPRMLLGLVRPTSGTGKLLGKPLGTSGGLASGGALVESLTFYPYLSGCRNTRLLPAHAGAPSSRLAPALT